MAGTKDLVTRLDIKFEPNANRVVCRSFNQKPEEIQRVSDFVFRLDESELNAEYNRLKNEFNWRHRDYDGILDRTFTEIQDKFSHDQEFSLKQRRVLASYFTMEYSIEGAALFNPSIVPHPDQTELSSGSFRFIMTLRAVGEGHISSVEFMSGVIDANGNIELDPRSKFSAIESMLEKLDDKSSSVNLSFSPDSELSERVIFPISPEEAGGIEDVRMVKFEDNGQSRYYGTFTAYDRRNIRPKMIETSDFLHFKIFSLLGNEIKDKGMALFPRKINGKYVMLSRQDGVSNWIMFSDDLVHWDSKSLLVEPQYTWDFMKTGNCGSPLETDKGWLVITHGVGPMRKYEIGACLLDRDNPEKVIACLKTPLISPNSDEREGYVPNVVYTSGAIIYNEILIIPYAMSDMFIGFARINVEDLISKMNVR